MRLALFDLDHTLIDFDSGLAWTRFLVGRGVLPADAEEVYLGYARQYVAGTLDIHAMHRATMLPLAVHPMHVLQAWADDFRESMAPRLRPDMQALVRRHLDDGDLCAIVTATDRLVSAPFAILFGIEHLVATEPEIVDGRVTGAIAGQPCFRGHKVTRVGQWLARLGAAVPAAIEAFDESWFYSDSISDLPLLQAVTHPVAVRPDPQLRALATQLRWRLT